LPLAVEELPLHLLLAGAPSHEFLHLLLRVEAVGLLHNLVELPLVLPERPPLITTKEDMIKVVMIREVMTKVATIKEVMIKAMIREDMTKGVMGHQSRPLHLHQLQAVAVVYWLKFKRGSN